MFFRVVRAKKEMQKKIDELDKRIERHESEARKYNDLLEGSKAEMQRALSGLEASKIGESMESYRFKRDEFWNKANCLGERRDGLQMALDLLNGKSN